MKEVLLINGFFQKKEWQLSLKVDFSHQEMQRP
jgi:hypothetical protein